MMFENGWLKIKHPPGDWHQAGGVGSSFPGEERQEGYRRSSQTHRQPEVAEELEAQGDNRDDGEDVDVEPWIHGRVFVARAIVQG